MMWTAWRESAFLKGVGGALAGGVLFLAVLHLWSDHTALHAVVTCINTKCWEPAAPGRLLPPTAAAPTAPTAPAPAPAPAK